RQARAYGLFYTLGIGAGAMSSWAFGAVSDQWGVATALAVIAGYVLAVLPMCGVLRPRLQ
ncbi:MAG: MFS transporter, partial [Gemmatimonadetes bacterium]|nr:MFS transporter [Gemmatimonadota bacterium]